MSRPYTCQACGRGLVTHAARGPLPDRCPPCKADAAPPSGPWVPRPGPATGGHDWPPAGGAPAAATVLADPFNSTPHTAPVPPSVVHDPPADTEPGPIEAQLQQELIRVTSTNPLAGTLGAVALRCARAADLAPATDLKAVLSAVKELRAVMAEISKSSAGGDDDDSDETPVGSSAPTVVHTPAY